jgi:FMN phosphatase YigB (HAD superfamily)
MIKLICSDCNGVLEHVDHDYSKSGYYITKEKNSEITDHIRKIIWDNKYLVKSWMTNEISYEEVSLILSNRLNIGKEYFNEILIQSIKDFEWNWELINLYQKYRQQGIKVIMTTDNMDVFSKIAIPYNNFNKYFDRIINSADIKLLKRENNYQFFGDISKEFKLNPDEILIVDDNKTIIEETKKIGYKTYLYNIETCINFEKRVSRYTHIKLVRCVF